MPARLEPPVVPGTGMAEREGFEPISVGEAKSLKWRGLS